ncbi:glycosyltransferase family 2 protein [Nonlabens ulvanivorans]|uniref:GT2 family glycosyltransferase n=1 Tax=Nonlabens ulvanivorans TaxID=906888 RepID=A0A084JYE6_NONUL|nr:glycosyltransferase family 2 protein [Nonlabens ulvanivorans]KEZ93980.1 glycosyl transferase family 2 [Nonlabens ulvanivorans]PRX14599.1 GT2 family glycosyltransferase [Nonlabens ulvanivorans]
MDLSIIILNYNAAAFLEQCLYSVLKAVNNIDAEVIVVDNDSTDHSVEMLQHNFPQVKLITNHENLGFSKGNNIGVQHAQGDYLCILNPDTVVGETVFDEVLAFAKANPQIAFTTTQLIDGTGTYLPESKRNVPTPQIARQKILGNDSKYYASHLQKDDNGEVEVLVGAMMVCKKLVFEELGGFDPMYFMYGEDIDLSYTALQHGYQNYYLGKLKVIHFKGESTVKDRKYLERFYGAMGLFYNKHFKKSKIEKALVDLALKGIIATKSIENESVVSTSNSYRVLVTNDNKLQIGLCDKVATYKQLSDLKWNSQTQFIWDTATLSFDEIINFMAGNISSQYTYRFLNFKRNLIIGSDSSSSRGEVKELILD